MKLDIKIGKTLFQNPVWVASGTFGNGKEFEEFVDLDKMGAILPKTVTLNAREGNPTPRVCETASGLLNSIGLENKGIKYFRKETVEYLKKFKARTVASIAGSTEKEFYICAKELTGKRAPHALEINLSCPNVEHKAGKHKLFAQDPETTARIIRGIKKITDKTVIAKLTPNVTDIADIALAAERAGADAVSLVNTYMGMAIDAKAKKPFLGNIAGGLSGPAIKPLALKAVWDVYKKIKIPIIGMGGIMTGKDVAEFMLAGATAVQVGTANFVNPGAYNEILAGFKRYLKEEKITKLKDLVGKAHRG